MALCQYTTFLNFKLRLPYISTLAFVSLISNVSTNQYNQRSVSINHLLCDTKPSLFCVYVKFCFLYLNVMKNIFSFPKSTHNKSDQREELNLVKSFQFCTMFLMELKEIIRKNLLSLYG